VDSGLHSIGETARLSGLSVSALRFYDGAGVFGPARVDPQTGYRWYAPGQLADARLIARLRRVGMPTSALALTRSAVRLGSSDSRRTARSRLRDIEIDRVLPRAQLDRALRVLDEAPTPR